MYEQNETPVFRRFLIIAIGFVLAVAIIWTLVWLIFLRHHSSPSTSTLHKPATSQSKSGSSSKPKTNTGSTATPSTNPPAAGSTTPPTSSSATPAADTPTELANTGAGNIFVPFAAATAAGSTFYYIRTRKKLLS